MTSNRRAISIIALFRDEQRINRGLANFVYSLLTEVTATIFFTQRETDRQLVALASTAVCIPIMVGRVFIRPKRAQEFAQTIQAGLK